MVVGFANRFSKIKRFPAKSREMNSILSMLKLCNSAQVLSQIHTRFIIHGVDQNPSLSSLLIDRYSHLSRLDLSIKLFQSLSTPHSLAYHAILRNLCLNGEFHRVLVVYRQMLAQSLLPDEHVSVLVVRACVDVSLCFSVCLQVHCHLLKFGLDCFASVGNALVEMYGNVCEIGDARRLFEILPSRNLASWNAIVLAVGESGDFMESFRLFKRMRYEGFEPDFVSLLGVLRLCVDLNSLEMGRLVHLLAILSNLSGDLSVNTALLMMYCKLGDLEMARQLFDWMEEKDCAVWNILISGYSKNGFPGLALELLVDMGKSGVRMDLFTAFASIATVTELKSLRWAKEIHGHVIRNGSDYQVSVHNSLIEMYCKCRSPEIASRIFDSLGNRSAVSWSSMIKGYINNGYSSKALLLFNEMKKNGVIPDAITLINVLPAFVNSAAFEQVKNIHGCSMKQGLNTSVSFMTALLVSYAKCGCIEMAQKIFDEEEIDRRDVVLWNSMIGAYSKHGCWDQCFKLYCQMRNLALKPDLVTFLGLLTACVNSGRVKEGRECFSDMVDVYGYQPDQEHYASMVDLLGRSGRLDEARKLIEKMPMKPDVRVWGPLLSACKLHSETELAEFAAEKIISMEPHNAANYVLLSNIYAAAGKWDDVARMRRFLRGGGLKKTPGISWLDINGQVHEFRVFDHSHPEAEDIYTMLRILGQEIKPENNQSY
ncbi:TPR-like protein [Dioscorea alata]|uniref:TPR-like protein n=1 Tax=Dioscorea alata TaxID=55571 RepID=A0ACB7U279_DIOAL|nr:TPR-like protein [Dioscorea alata]